MIAVDMVRGNDGVFKLVHCTLTVVLTNIHWKGSKSVAYQSIVMRRYAPIGRLLDTLNENK